MANSKSRKKKEKSTSKPTTSATTPTEDDVQGRGVTDLLLPPRLFATDRFPVKRLNIYSTPEILPFIHRVLRGTPEWEYLRQSPFGKLFDIPSRQCPVSCKLIHSFLSRQLLCCPKHTLYSVFGGNPLRFGLEEFGTITGLDCSPFPEGYHPNMAEPVPPGGDKVWLKVIGKKEIITIAELCSMLETKKNMSRWRKLRLALIIIVDGVLIAHQQDTRPTPRYVTMLDNLEAFFAFPWGRESFLKTISCMKPPTLTKKNKRDDPVTILVGKLKQDSFRLQGFPLALQLVAFRAIPQLLAYIPAPDNQRTIMDLEDGHLPQHPSINSNDIFRVEFAPDLQVTPFIPIERPSKPGWGVWPDDPKEESVIYLEKLIDDKHTFNKAMWPGGVASEPLNVPPEPKGEEGVVKEKVRLKQSLKPKPVNKKKESARKQRRISSYFTRSKTNGMTNEQLTEIVVQLQSDMNELRQLLKRKKKRSHGRLSSFHSLRFCRKKSNTTLKDDISNDQDLGAMEIDELPVCHHPIIIHDQLQTEAPPLNDEDPNLKNGISEMDTCQLPQTEDPPLNDYVPNDQDPGDNLAVEIPHSEPLPLNDYVPNDQDAMDTDELPACQSPIFIHNQTHTEAPSLDDEEPKFRNDQDPGVMDKVEMPQSEPLPLNDDVTNEQDVGEMETVNSPSSQSPIISQYAAQLHRQSTENCLKPQRLPTH